MKQTFIKNIQGHQLQFNKQTQMNAYNISPTDFEFEGVLSLQKDEKGMWTVNDTKPAPAWFNEISMFVHYAIEENETRKKVDSDFLQFTYPF